MSMTRKRRASKRKLAAIGASVLALTAGAVAAVTALGQDEAKPRQVRAGAGTISARDLAAAASYLGVPAAQLASEVRSGKSLAQLADATSGKSSSGLIAALVSDRRRRLSALGANVTRHVTAEVNRRGAAVRLGGRLHGARLGGLGGGRDRLGDVAARYLGLSQVQLQDKLRSGRTLAQLANGTRGKSESGLVGALVAARRQRIEALAGRPLTPARTRDMEARLVRRFTTLANRVLMAG
jgi:hypothetical protein